MSCARCNGPWKLGVDFDFAMGPLGKLNVCAACNQKLLVLVDRFICTPDAGLPADILQLPQLSVRQVGDLLERMVLVQQLARPYGTTYRQAMDDARRTWEQFTSQLRQPDGTTRYLPDVDDGVDE